MGEVVYKIEDAWTIEIPRSIKTVEWKGCGFCGEPHCEVAFKWRRNTAGAALFCSVAVCFACAEKDQRVVMFLLGSVV